MYDHEIECKLQVGPELILQDKSLAVVERIPMCPGRYRIIHRDAENGVISLHLQHEHVLDVLAKPYTKQPKEWLQLSENILIFSGEPLTNELYENVMSGIKRNREMGVSRWIPKRGVMGCKMGIEDHKWQVYAAYDANGAVVDLRVVDLKDF